MKATLIVGTDRLTVDISCMDLKYILDIMVDRMGQQAQNAEVIREKTKETTDAGTQSTESAPSKTGLFFFRCPDCRVSFARRLDRDFGMPGDIVTCNCGCEITVTDVKQASGECNNCGQAFWNIGMVNDRREFSCRFCKSPIILYEQANGRLGTEKLGEKKGKPDKTAQ